MTHLAQTLQIFKTDKMGAYLHAITDPNYNGSVPFEKFCEITERTMRQREQRVIDEKMSKRSYCRD